MSIGRLLGTAGKLLVLLVVIGVLYAYAMFQGGTVSWFLFYSVVCILLGNVVFMLHPLRWVEVERRFDRNFLSHDEKMTVTLLLKKKLAFPMIFLTVVDEVPPGLEGMGKAPGTIFFFAGAKQLSYTYEIRGSKRGEYWFSPVVLKTGDLFGFFQKEHHEHIEDSLTVLPRLRSLKQWHALWNDKEETTPVSTRMMEDTFSVAGVRDYVPGDKMTSIDWKVTARSGKLVTKEFESQAGKGYTVILENTTEEKQEDTFEENVEFAASIINDCYKQAIPVGIGVSTEKEPLLEEDAKRSHFQNIYRELARLEKSDLTFDEAPFFKQPVHDRSIVYITSKLTVQRIDELQALLKNRNEVVIGLFQKDPGLDDMQDNLSKLKKQGAGVIYFQSESDMHAFDVTS